MNTFVNTYALSATVFDSSSLGVLCTSCHLIKEPGEYLGQVHRGKAIVGTFRLQASQQDAPAQVDVDLAGFAEPPTSARREPSYRVAPGGYLVLFVSAGSGGYAVTLEQAGKDKTPTVFDSRALQDSDLFAVTLIRPGRYGVTNVIGNGAATLTVPYPSAGRVAKQGSEPVTIVCSDKGLIPERADVLAGQGVVFQVRSRASIRVTLEEADDAPPVKGKEVFRSVRWTKPITEVLRDPTKPR